MNICENKGILEFLNIDNSGLLDLLEKGLNWVISAAGNILIALIFLVVALKIIKVLMKFLKKNFEKSKMDSSVATFLLSLISIGLKIVVFITAAAIVGFEITSFVAVLGSAGIAVGLALQGSLSNLAGGVLILLLKPFKVGDYIVEDNKGNEGTVVSIDIFYTKLRTVDNKIIVIPNGILSNTSLTNVTAEGNRRIDLVISVGYEQNIKVVRDALTEIIKGEKAVLSDLSIDIFVDSFNASSVDFGVRVWVHTDEYWSTKWSLMEKIKYEFDKKGISIPYQQVDVNIKNN